MSFALQIVTVLLASAQAYLKQAEQTGKLQAEVEQYRSAVALLQGILKHLASDSSDGSAMQFVKQALSIYRTYVQDHVADALYEKALAPEYAAAMGSKLYDALCHVAETTAHQQDWLLKRFRRPIVNALLNRPYHHLTPSDLNFKLAELAIVLDVLAKDASRASARVDIQHEPSAYLLPAATRHFEPMLQTLLAELQPILPTATSAATMSRLHDEYQQFLLIVREEVRNRLRELERATHPGGGIDARVLHTQATLTVFICITARLTILHLNERLPAIGQTVDAQ